MKEKQLGSKNQKQGIKGELFVMKKLCSKGWIVIPTSGSKSAIDLIAFHKKKKKWWGIQVKTTTSNLSFDFDRLSSICYKLYFTPVLALVKVGKIRDCQFCMKKNRVFYHVSEDETFKHPLGSDWDCDTFKQIVTIRA